MSDKDRAQIDVVAANLRVPYSLISTELEGLYLSLIHI